MRAAAAGKMLLPSRAIAARRGKKVRDGAPLEPLPSVPRKGSGKPEPFVAFFVELIGQDPDITLVELQAALLAAHGVSFSTSGIDALRRRHGYTYKKGMIARERDTPEVRKARHDRGRRQKVMREQPQRLIFPDETGTDTRMTREYGRSLRVYAGLGPEPSISSSRPSATSAISLRQMNAGTSFKPQDMPHE